MLWYHCSHGFRLQRQGAQQYTYIVQHLIIAPLTSKIRISARTSTERICAIFSHGHTSVQMKRGFGRRAGGTNILLVEGCS